MQAYRRLNDSALTAALKAAVRADHRAMADCIALIAEFDSRRLYLPHACSSMFVYCVRELLLSEDVAYHRIRAARAARRFPIVLDALADGRLSLRAIKLLAPHLTRRNGHELIEAAFGKTNAQVLELLAERFPRPDMPTLFTELPPVAEPMPAAHAPATALPAPSATPETQLVARPVAPSAGVARVTPLAPQRFALQVTVSGVTREKLERARELLGHAVPGGDLAQVLDRALDALVRELETRKFGATAAPRARSSEALGRYIPAEVRRAVRLRDGDRCTFVSATGARCGERMRLEFDHVLPVALGGRTTVDNLRLRCRAHNAHTAEQALGKGWRRSEDRETACG